MKKAIGCLLVGSALTLAAVLIPALWIDQEPLPGENLTHPLKKLYFHSEDEAYVVASPGVSLATLVDLSPFNGLWPGVTPNEAEPSLGQFQESYKEQKSHDTVYVYHRPKGMLEIVEQLFDSEGSTGFKWFLRWKPLDRRPEASIRPALLAILSQLPHSGTLNVQSDDGAVLIEFKDGMILSLWWLRRGARTPVGDASQLWPRSFSRCACSSV